MAKILYNLAALTVIVCVLFSNVNALETCSEAEAMENVNLTLLLGDWYEVARNPANPSVNCVAVNLNLSDNDTLVILTTYADDSSAWYKNKTAMASITLSAAADNNNTAEIKYNTTTFPVSSLKILDTDHKDYVLACSYTNASDPNTSTGVVMSRNRIVANSTLQQWITDAVKNYSDFIPNMPMVVQSELCYKDSASSISVTSGMLILLFGLLKLFH